MVSYGDLLKKSRVTVPPPSCLALVVPGSHVLKQRWWMGWLVYHTHIFLSLFFCFKSKPQYNKSHSVQYNNMYRIIFWQFGTIIMSTWAEMLPASAGRMKSWTAGFIILVMCCLIFLKTFDSFVMRQKMAATALCHSVRGYWTLYYCHMYSRLNGTVNTLVTHTFLCTPRINKKLIRNSNESKRSLDYRARQHMNQPS